MVTNFSGICLIMFIDKCFAGIVCKFSGTTQFKNISKICEFWSLQITNYVMYLKLVLVLCHPSMQCYIVITILSHFLFAVQTV